MTTTTNQAVIDATPAVAPINLLNLEATMVEPAEAPKEKAETPKTLDEYAKAILEAHKSAEAANKVSKKSGREAIDAATKAGRYLIQVKEQVGHGNWLTWLKKNCQDISEKTAQRYMALVKSDRLTDLKQCTSLWQAYLCSGAAKPGHLDKNPETNQENGHAEAEVPSPKTETPEIILGQMQRQIVSFQNLYERLVKKEPELEDNLFNCSDVDMAPLPILLNNWHHSFNDALLYFGLSPMQGVCACCGHVKKPNEVFGSIYPDVPEYARRFELCDECIAKHKNSKTTFNIADEIRAVADNVKELKSLSVRDYTLAQKLSQLQETTVAEPGIIAAAENNVWTPADLNSEEATIAAIQQLSPKIMIVEDKATHQLWNIYRHYVSSAVNNQTPGRFIKFLVVDDGQTGKPVLGIGAISGDFAALGPRDDFIGWSKEQRENGKLNNIAVASTIVPTQPFGFNFNGGKLIAALVTSQTIRDEWQSRYGDVLVGMTTTSLFGSYSMYKRIKEWQQVGNTAGSVPIQPKLDIYNKWKGFLKSTRAYEFREMMKQDADVSGPVTNYKGKVLAMIYKAAGLKLADFQHGHHRGIFFSEFYENTKDFLCGKVAEDDLKMKPLFEETTEQITERWRIQAIKRYQNRKREGDLKPQKQSYSQLGQMDFQAARELFLDDEEQ